MPQFLDRRGLTRLLEEQGVVINAESPDSGGRPLWLSLVIGFVPTLLLVGVFIWFARRMSGGRGGILGRFGRSTARRVDQDDGEGRVSFDDVAGIDEAENELVEIVDFLKNPDRYAKLGARIPRGVLLYGPPGTGKTLLARAVAGEADAAFFSMSASEFVEAIVGVGASRVRDLFKQAKEAGPAIVFIDELDAIGRSRSGGASGISGGHDEREQTLNQILTEMDGFEPDTNVIVLGATQPARGARPGAAAPGPIRPPHRRPAARQARPRRDPEDPHAVCAARRRRRPRADRGVHAGRHRRRPRADRQRGGALRRAPRSHRGRAADLTDAIEKIILGAERQIVMTDADRERTAYHESGHALVGMLTAGRRPRPQDLDHPARAGARRDAFDARDRPLRLHARRAGCQDQGGARRARRRAGRLRPDHDRRRIRHPDT